MAHSRRRFYVARLEGSPEALGFIGQFRRLYQIEDEVRHADPNQRRAIRLQKTSPFWRVMKCHAHQLQADPRLLPQSSLAKAVRYFLHEYTALLAYLRDGRFEIDNNLVYAARGISAVMPTARLCHVAKLEAGLKAVFGLMSCVHAA